ncbi:Laccase domain protein yfiH [Corynebacterium renale]|uniref:peptidoglycan editing factor PgeF n=1 Tax=Corynebacterium renale TaxID=1724 RepID=UPI000DA2E5F0|nr:peptidoglycan editing factor PgeF [Corynebacterium renale]SQG65002.1 Laccase domain protein yfiH [Corynebacterium renale]STC97080.1 Laccase domain protein yfiH [Corynebacterium renale]
MTNTHEHPARRVFTTRAGGVSSHPYSSFNLAYHVGDEPSAVAANRRRLAEVIGVPAENFVWLEQLHTNTVAVVDKPISEPIEATDAVVTTTPGLALAVMVADCVPVLLADETSGVIAAVHAGRMGARNGIVPATVKVMEDRGARPDRIHALLGPAAGGQSYEVPEQMAADVEKHLPGSRTRTAQGTPALDIRAGLVRQLMSLGITAIDADPRDTITDHDFFSHRREGTTGRQVGLIWMDK